MGNIVNANIQYFFTRGKGKDTLLKLSRTTSSDKYDNIDLADMEVYSIFKPILAACGYTRQRFIDSNYQRKAYRELALSLCRKFRRNKEKYKDVYPEAYDRNGELSIDGFSRLLNTITTDWSKVYMNASPDDQEQTYGQRLAGLSLERFILLDKETRRGLVKKSTEKEYPVDYAIYKAFQRDIEDTKKISFHEYIYDEEKKTEYRQKLNYVKRELELQRNRPLTISETVTHISKASDEWYDFITTADMIMQNGKQEFARETPLERFCLLSEADRHQLEHKLLDTSLQRIKSNFPQEMKASNQEVIEMLEPDQNSTSIASASKK